MDDRINVIISDDNMVGYVKLLKDEEEEAIKPLTSDEILHAISESGIVFGIKDDSVNKLAERPIYGLKIEVVRGEDPIDGQDGYTNFLVKKDSEYKPEYSEEGVVDYKNLDYFQMVQKGQVLCEIVKETKGIDGKNIFGATVEGKSGRPPVSPMGKNTEFNEDETKLIASVSGVVKFIKDSVDVNEVLNIRSDVDQTTGNINFPGDVVVGGDVSYGFSVKGGGNVTVRGMVEGAHLEAMGDVHVSKGINGAGGEKIVVGGNLKSGYIENADIHAEGNIVTDYIIDSNIMCKGSIELVGRNELIIGGTVRLFGELSAKTIGSENERPTNIEILGTAVGDMEAVKKLRSEQKDYVDRAAKIMSVLRKYSRFGDFEDDGIDKEQLTVLRQQHELMRSYIDELALKIKDIEDNMSMEYRGFIKCKKKIYQGVKIYFGNEVFRFGLDNIEHCKIYYHEGEIVQGVL